MIKNLFIDLDDTLIHCSPFYDWCIDRFCKHRKDPGFKEELYQRITDGVPVNGYGAQNTIQAMSAMIPPIKKKTILSIYKDIMSQFPIIFLPGVMETLPYLSKKYKCYLVTKGHHGDQEKKVKKSGIERFFKKVFIVPDKTEKTFLEIMQAEKLKPHQTCAVGDSVRSEVNPAMKAGMSAILIPYQGNNWKHETVPMEIEDKSRFIQVKSFNLVPDGIYILNSNKR